MRRRVLSLGVWALLIVVAGLIAVRARYTADMSAFLPRAPSKSEQILVDQLRDGLVSRLILIDIEGADAPARARLSKEVASRLRGDPAFREVMNGELVGLDRDREFVFAHRYLLSEHVTPEHFTIAGLRAAIADGIELMSSPMGLLVTDLFVRDPTGETLQTLAQFEQPASRPRSVDGIWVSADGRRALLLAETRAEGSDTDAQERAIRIIHRAFAAADAERSVSSPVLPHAELRLTGPGVFAVESRATIKSEAIRLSMLSSAVIAIFLLFVYRSLVALLLGLLPVVSGALAGVAAVALGFGVVHGVTLGFGVTLIGEAVDYSVYLFIQRQPGIAADSGVAAWTTTFWPTVRLGMLTSICGFASLVPSTFPGLSQLGVYSIAGLLAAGLTTRFVLPGLLPKKFTLSGAVPLGRAIARAFTPIRALRGALWLLPVIAGLALFAHRDRLWTHELSALSPVPLAEQTLDAELRSDLGAPDIATLVIVTGRNPEEVLIGSEALEPTLDELVTSGAIAGYQSPSRYLPSAATQELRRASLPAPEDLAERLHFAVAALPIRAARLQPFLVDVEAARTAGVIRRSDLEQTSLASAIDALLVHHGDEWTGLLPLQAAPTGPHARSVDEARVTRAIAATARHGIQATVLNLSEEADALYSDYLSEALRLSLLGFGVILVLLLVSLRSVARVARVIAPLILAVLAVTAGFALAGHALTILHLIGLLLIVAIGSNYALFFDREPAGTDAEATARTLESLVVANLSTVFGFGILSLSTVPVFAALGSTVAPGTFLALLFSAALARHVPFSSQSG